MMNPKNFRTLGMMCAAAFTLGLSACSTDQTQSNSDAQTSKQIENSTGNSVSDQAFVSEGNKTERTNGTVNTASNTPTDEADKEMGTRVRHKRSKRAVASVEEK